MGEAPLLICYDDSDGARNAVDAAVELLGEKRAVVLEVARPLTAAEAYAGLATVPFTFEELNQAEAQQSAGRGAEYAPTAGLDAEGRGDLGVPTWKGIVDVADEIGAAVIVIGTRALSAAQELFEGSLSTRSPSTRAGRC